MNGKQSRIDAYEITKICFALCFIAALKVWDSTKSMELSLMAFFGPIFVWLMVKGIRRHYRRKALLESGIDKIDTMSGEEFEELLLAHYINLGYIGMTTSKTGDY